MKRALFTILFAATAMAQVGAPTLGLLPDGGTVRAMTGIASAASVGPLLGGGAISFTQVVVPQSGAFALASMASGDVAVVTVGSDGVTLNTVVITGAISGNLYLSPNGSSGLIANGGQLQVITGLPGSPTAQPVVDASYLGAASALAVSDDGQWVAGVFGGTVYALGSSGQAIPLPAPPGVTALTFFHGNDNLAVTTAVQIIEISAIASGMPTASTIFGSASTPPPPEAPIALALTADNSTVVLIEPDGGIGQVVLATGAVSTAKCGCTPQGLTGLGGSVFLLSSLSGGSVKVYDAASGNVLFVPLAAASTQGGQQ